MLELTEEDALHIARNLCPRDLEEVLCVLPDGMSIEDWAKIAARVHPEESKRQAWVVKTADGEPAVMCGVTVVSVTPWVAITWAVGTARRKECGAAVMKTAIKAHRIFDGLGVKRYSCTCLDGPNDGSEWLERLGYVLEGRLMGLGRQGQNFLQWGRVNHGN